jgi:hypothetical protein
VLVHNQNSGVLSVRYNGEVRGICDDGFTDNDA